ncbi:MAG: hypothetical protein U0Q55_09880 [Vicinamibacterales bacterium]
MWNRCAFTVADREYLWRDVALAAMWRGDWSAFDDRLRRGLACEAWSYEYDDPADQDAVDAATVEFRYANELITAEETELWLERMALSVEVWSRYFARQNLLARWPDRLDEILDTFPQSDETVAEHVLAEGICSGWLRSQATALAGRAAVSRDEAASSGLDVPALDERQVETLASSGSPILAGVDPDALRDRLAHLSWLDAVFGVARAKAITAEALQAQIESSRLDWIEVELERLSFPEESMVRETLLCCQEDALSLPQLASRIRRSVTTEVVRLESSDPEFRALLLSAEPGALLGPVAAEDAFHALVVRDKRLPSADDAAVRALAEAAVEDALLRRARMLHVQWKQWI